MNKNKRVYPPVGMYSILIGILVLLVSLTLIIWKIELLLSSTLGLVVVSTLGFNLFLFLAIVFDINLLSTRRNPNRIVMDEKTGNKLITVALTAYNDELSIFDSVLDFLAHPNVKRVIVVDNNSTDKTASFAESAGALVICEEKQGYGHCVYRALFEASKYIDTELVILCEGDLTFRARDIDKFLAYEAHGDIINGTRISEQLRMPDTQLTNFIYFGNFFVGKLLEVKHLGKGTITDVGTTYKLCKSKYLRENLLCYNSSINHEFNAHFLDKSLEIGARIVEVPITFYKRVGQSKGGNRSNSAAIKVGLKMIKGIALGWPTEKKKKEKRF